MKITLEPTGASAAQFRTVSVARNHDDLDAEEAVAMLLDALTAWTFARQSVIEAMRAQVEEYDLGRDTEDEE